MRSSTPENMPEKLWDFDELTQAAGGSTEGSPAAPITGVSIDTRSLKPGDLFVALKDQRDGHEFVTQAFADGAAAALVSSDYARKPGDGALISVADTLAGLTGAGIRARARLHSDARVVAVTGSVGKTGTKEMLRACLSRIGPTHAADKSFNNHWGVPLTLARMPAGARFGVFEIGMNHAGEITPLTRMVRPHVAIVTTVEPVHLEYFASVDEIAEAKAEIFAGLEPDGVAVVNRDNRHCDLLAERARAKGARVVTFGLHATADVRPSAVELGADATTIIARVGKREIAYRLGTPGAHIAQNSLAVVAALDALGVDLDQTLPALVDVTAPPGRGSRTVLGTGDARLLLIDESYNANPASMRAALLGLASVPRDRYARRVAVLGDMLELGAEAPRLHADLEEAVDAAGADLVFASGPNMAHLYARLAPGRRAAWAETSEGIKEALVAAVRPGDVVMVKGSLGSRMALLVDAVKANFEPCGHEAGRV